MSRGHLATGTVIALLMGGLACERLLAIDGTVTVAPAEACGVSLPEGPCQACVTSSCCSQAATCAGDPGCAGYESCLLGCGSDYACRFDCGAGRAGAVSGAVAPLDTCVALSCADACGTTCGLPGMPTYPDAAAACAACVATSVCAPAQACARDLSCESLARCQESCSALDCQTACNDEYDAATFLPLEVQLITGCLADCHLGNNWSCVGKVSWDALAPGENDVTLTVRDSTTHALLSGAEVSACDRSDVACATPLASGTTDAQGQVLLPLPARPAAGLGFNGYADVFARGEQHELFFLGAPLSEIHARFNFPMLSSSAFLGFASQAKVTLDPNRGHIAVEALDCSLAPASDVTFQVTGIDGATTLAYLSSGVLAPDATHTDVEGFAFLFNVPAGLLITIEAVPADLGATSSRVSVFARPGVLSSAAALPTP